MPDLRVAIKPRHAHANRYLTAFDEGLRRHGITATWSDAPQDCDLAVVWSHNESPIIERQRQMGRRYLVLEAAILGDRLESALIGFDGLNGRARFAPAWSSRRASFSR